MPEETGRGKEEAEKLHELIESYKEAVRPPDAPPETPNEFVHRRMREEAGREKNASSDASLEQPGPDQKQC